MDVIRIRHIFCMWSISIFWISAVLRTLPQAFKLWLFFFWDTGSSFFIGYSVCLFVFLKKISTLPNSFEDLNINCTCGSYAGLSSAAVTSELWNILEMCKTQNRFLSYSWSNFCGSSGSRTVPFKDKSGIQLAFVFWFYSWLLVFMEGTELLPTLFWNSKYCLCSQPHDQN